MGDQPKVVEVTAVPVGAPDVNSAEYRSGRTVILPRSASDEELLAKQKSRHREKRHKLANVLTEEKLQEMFSAYCHQPTYAYVARACNVHQTTVSKYAEEHNWEDRRQAIFASALANADYTIQKATEDSLLMILNLKTKIASKIETMEAKDLDPKTLDWCLRLVKSHPRWRLTLQMHKVWMIR